MSYQSGTSSAHTEASTPAGNIVLLQMMYTSAAKSGVWVLVAAAGISLLAVLGLLVFLGVSGYKTMRTPTVHRFMRTHVAAYFVSLLLCDVISTFGSLMNGRWIAESGVHLGAFCTAQGAVKNAGNVGTAMWSLVIAIHTFCLLVMKWRSNDYVLYATLVIVWLFIGLVVVIGPSSVQNIADKGPYFGVSGYWCWITDGYATERVTLEYLWMFLSAFVSFLLYSIAILSLRGNVIKSGGKLRIRLGRSSSTWEAQTGRDSPDGQAMNLAKRMLAYPIAYTALILPIAVCRFMEWSGHDVPFEATIFSDAVFMLSGLVNVTLFLATRKIVPTRDVLFSRSRSTTSDIESQTSMTVAAHVTPFVVSEKSTVSPVNHVASVPVSVPVPAMNHPRVGKSTVPKRNASHGALTAFVDTQKPIPDVPKSPRRSIIQPSITPKVVEKASARNNHPGPTLPEPAMLVPRGVPAFSPSSPEELSVHHDDFSDVTSLYSVSSYTSTAPLQEMSPVPLTPRELLKPPPSSSRNGARGTPF